MVNGFPKEKLIPRLLYFVARARFCVVMGKSLESPEEGNVDKMSEEMFENCLEGLKTQISDIF